MRRIAPALLVASLLLGGAACGKDDTASDAKSSEQKSVEQKSSSPSGDLTGFVEGFSDPTDGIATRQEAECVVGQIEDDISDAGRVILNEQDSNGNDMGDRDAELVFAAVDECITLDKMVAKFQKLLAADSGADGVETAKCLGDAMRSEYSSSGEIVRDSFRLGQDGADQSDNTLQQLITTCAVGAVGGGDPTGGSSDPSGSLNAAIYQTLVDQMQSQGLDEATATCVADVVTGELTPADFAKIGQAGGALPPEVQGLIEAAVTGCIAGN